MLRLHKLRAFLTMLGVIIGVMSVTIIVMISNGFQFYMTNQFKKLGSDTMFIVFDPGRNHRQTLGKYDGLTTDDVTYLTDRVKLLDVAAPIVQVPQQKIFVGEHIVDNPRIYASDEKYTVMNRMDLTEGRTITKEDVDNRANVAVIGPELSMRLFPEGHPIGKYVQFRDLALEVIGVTDRVDIMGGTNARDILIPITTAQDKWVGGNKLMMISMRPKSGVKVDDAMEAVWEAMMVKSNNRPIYRLDSQESITAVFSNIFGVAGIVLAAIAALSLLVGGIGIMNIMLVSVTERTKEIGLRKAVGAKRGSILTQFIVEAATLSLVGGLIGMTIAYGLGMVVTIATSSMKWPNEGGLPTPFPITAGIGAAIFSAFIGVVFGLYPAMSAAKLDPIIALRRE